MSALSRTTQERESRSDAELVIAARLGDRSAFDVLVCRYWAGAVNVVYRLCGNAHLAEEAAQEAFLRAWQRLKSYRTDRPFRSWLYRIAVNLALDALRREREVLNVETLSLASEEDGPEAALAQNQQIERVRQAVLALPPAARAVLVLREYEGLTYEEIAETLDIPAGTVMSRLNYARQKLRQILAPEMEELL